jgi:hypothetical protein
VATREKRRKEQKKGESTAALILWGSSFKSSQYDPFLICRSPPGAPLNLRAPNYFLLRKMSPFL